MNECIELLKKEIRSLTINLNQAENRPGVKSDEIENIKRKLRLKNEILSVVLEASK